MRYRYRFGEASNLAWFTAAFAPKVVEAGGYVDVVESAAFVSLPDEIEPESVGMMWLFAYDEVCDGDGRLVGRVVPDVAILHEIAEGGPSSWSTFRYVGLPKLMSAW